MCVCMYVHMHECVCIYVHVRVCIDECMYSMCVYVTMYVCMYVCMCLYVCACLHVCLAIYTYVHIIIIIIRIIIIIEQKTLQFKGRIPVANIEIENIEDGTGRLNHFSPLEISYLHFQTSFSSADYHTSGTTVVNGWKVRNLAKNKWFVLIAKTPGEKQQWIDAIKGQKDRIQSTSHNTYMCFDNRA